MTETIIAILFLVGYLLISLEHPLKMNKSAIAILLAVGCWMIYWMSGVVSVDEAQLKLSSHLSDVAQIVFFLLAAMTIVEIIDRHNGFLMITRFIKTNDKKKLMWIICMLTFFLSAILDNLTTSIVMVAVLKKLIDDKDDRMIMSCLVIIAANAGGAFSPIGDVTTTMLWIGGQVSAVNIVKELFLPSLISLLVPLIYQSFRIKGNFARPVLENDSENEIAGSRLVFLLGMSCFLSVPIFNHFSNLPPYMAMLFGLSLIWIITELLHAKNEERKHLRVSHMLSKIDLNSLLFFVGILLAVACLQTAGILDALATSLEKHIANQDIIITTLGLLSSVIDNVPLVAATMGMYPLHLFPTDSKIWEMIALCAGTGGSILIIGSAAGVVVMGSEKINFMWYFRKISFTALIGYLAGVGTYLLFN